MTSSTSTIAGTLSFPSAEEILKYLNKHPFTSKNIGDLFSVTLNQLANSLANSKINPPELKEEVRAKLKASGYDLRGHAFALRLMDFTTALEDCSKNIIHST